MGRRRGKHMCLHVCIAIVCFTGKAACQCSRQAGKNGPFDTYLAAIDSVTTVAACEAMCSRTPGCTLYKYCNGGGPCTNWWAHGGYESEKGSCVLGAGGFAARGKPGDASNQGFIIGMCVPDFQSVPDNALPKRLRGTTVQSLVAKSAAECEQQCTITPACRGYNFCFAAVCGDAVRGRCDLKQFTGAATYMGDTGVSVGGGWVSGGLARVSAPAIQQQGQLGGSVIILDVNSITYDGGYDNPGIMVSSPGECADACKDHPKCNTWTFCMGSNCGRGCRHQVEYNPLTPLDYTRFGKYSGCMCPANSTDCSWPGKMCTLKFNVGDAVAMNSTEPWVSGIV